MTTQTKTRQSGESFQDMRDRLHDVHGWSRKTSSLAARYYNGDETVEELHRLVPGHADEIIRMR